jgi:ABC-type spermidine/putrescine transport system permease subunit II
MWDNAASSLRIGPYTKVWVAEHPDDWNYGRTTVFWNGGGVWEIPWLGNYGHQDNISYVIVTVRARLSGFDRRLEEASADLGADGWQTFWRVTFPLILPGLAAAGLLAFSLSIDDFVITNFTAGRTTTFPMFVWGSARVGVPPQVNAIGTIFFVVAVSAVAVGSFLQRRRA